MFIFYKTDTGEITFTINGDTYPESLLQDGLSVIEMPDGSVTTLAGMGIVDAVLQLIDLTPVQRAFRDSVNAKRANIIISGTDILVSGHGSVALQGRPEDQTSLQGLAFGAQLRLGMGDSTTLMDFLDRNNTPHQLTPMQILELWQKGAAFISAIYTKSWEIKEMDPFTTDVNDPTLWTV